MWNINIKNIANSFFRKNEKKLKFEPIITQKENNKGKSLENMIVYVDENGHLTSTPQVIKKTAGISDCTSEWIQK
ncbi:hypothetical protein [Flavobacterium sp. H122]|uniref:hypothetical protein n=1 Tax=Flavobacterium sp. H122 TaxID=2529860 RepID=UPI0010AA6646|nr:hypothetical protein [Flavobacterium sp. H122]